MIGADSPEIQAVLKAWHESCRADYERTYPRIGQYYDRDLAKRATTRRKYIALDRGSSGVYLVDRKTGMVYTIKAYGVPKRVVGPLSQLLAIYSSPRPWLA